MFRKSRFIGENPLGDTSGASVMNDTFSTPTKGNDRMSDATGNPLQPDELAVSESGRPSRSTTYRMTTASPTSEDRTSRTTYHDANFLASPGAIRTAATALA
jgi:hypothetical protein